MNRVSATSTTAQSTESAPKNAVQVRVAGTATGTTFTPEQVCDLPLDVLLSELNVRLRTIDTDQPQFREFDFGLFFGYRVARASSVTIFTRQCATEAERDIAIRYLLTQHLGLPTHLFPAEMQHTVYIGPNHDEVAE